MGIQAQQAGAQRVGGVGAVAADVPHQGQRHAIGDDGGHQADAHQAQFRQAEHAFDQRMVEQVVDHGAAQADHHHRSGLADGAGKAAQGHEAQVAGQGKGQDRQELPGRLHVGFGLAEHQQYWLQVPQQQRRRQGHQPRQPQPGLGEAGGAVDIARAVANGDQGAHGRDHADAEDRHERIARRAQATAGQGLGAQARHHQGVGQHHQHVRQL